jgi:N-ethylmaleimide reductase
LIIDPALRSSTIPRPTKEAATDHLHRDLIDLAAFGRPFISDPDLVARLTNDWLLAKADETTFYGGGSEGYTDYPTHTRSRHHQRLAE